MVTQRDAWIGAGAAIIVGIIGYMGVQLQTSSGARISEAPIVQGFEKRLTQLEITQSTLRTQNEAQLKALNDLEAQLKALHANGFISDIFSQDAHNDHLAILDEMARGGLENAVRILQQHLTHIEHRFIGKGGGGAVTV